MSAERAREIRQLQKAKEKAQRGGHLVEEAALCNQLGEILASCGRYEEALEEHRQELRLLEGAGDGLGCAVAHRKIGERLAEMENYEAALKHQHQHLELARGLADETEQQRAWATIGRTYMFMAESDGTVAQEAWRKAERAFHTSLTIVEEKLEGAVPGREVTEMRTRLYLNLGLVYDSLKDPAKSHQYIRKSIFLADQGRLTEDLYRAYFNLGHIQLREGDHSGALRCLARARDCARRMKEKGLESDCCSSTAQVLLSLGDFAAAKRSLKQAYLLGPSQPWQRDLLRANLRYASKLTRLQEGLEEAVAGGDLPVALSLCEQLGDIFSKHGDYSRAVESYQRQLSLAQELGRPPREVAVIHVSLATTFGDLKDHARAIHHYQQELALHQGDALEEGKTWLNMALAMEEAGEPPPQIQSCLQTALERAQVAGDPRVQGLTPLGTLERWLRAYGPELDQETWQRCQHTQSLLRQAAAPAQSQPCQDSVPEGDGDAGDGDMVPLKPVRKRLRAPVLDGRDMEGLEMEPEPCGAAAGEVGSAKSLSGGTKSISGGTGGGKSLPNGARSLPSGTKSLLGNTKSLPSGTKSHPGGAKSLFGTTKPLPSVANALPGGTNPSISSGTVAACRPPALIPVEQYLEEENWLEDDLGEARGGRKRPRRDPQDLLSASGDSTAVESDGGGPAAVRHRPRRCRQSRLTSLVRRGCREQKPPEAAGNPLSGGEEEEEEEEEGGAPTPAPPGPLPGALPTLRVRVRVQDSVFLIPVPQSSPPHAVSWLAARAAERFYQGSGLLPRLSLRRDGALLAPQDPVGDVLQSNEEVLAEVQGWDLPPLAERYRRACQSLAVDVHPLLLKLPPLLRALKLQERLRQLRLRGCGLTDAVATELLATLGTLPALTHLDLAGNRLGARGLRDLLPQQPHTFQSLEELNLSLNPLGDASCRPLTELLQRCPALTTLRLDACGFTDAFHLEGKSPWHRVPRLQRLSLSQNALGAAGLARLLGSLPCHSLARLELGSITGPAPQPLALALAKFLAQEGCALSHLTLSGNRLGDGDVLQVARCLPACPALVSLDFSANPGITTAGLRSLLNALDERHQGLQFLSLAGCSVEAPLEAVSAGKIQELRLCGRHAKASEAWHGAARLCTLTRHHKLFWKNL
ncbi:tonsoku-like protein [Indicator indicator]|uniref:tonsoku-like protein n=1 Tax=Indicator indicator TaxID=1002788 RepID=UPI0023E00696|nr:tonsoku-like protein [Indicator indicator]